MKFNLSEWTLRHRSLVLYMIIVVAVAGAMSYMNLGRSEDPAFTFKAMVIRTIWPGATAQEMQDQVADRIEKYHEPSSECLSVKWPTTCVASGQNRLSVR